MVKKWTYIITIVAILFASFTFPLDKGKAATLTDIPKQYEKEINYLVNKKIINGYGDGTFRPDRKVTREEAATMIGIALQLDGTKRATKFKDVKKSSYASGYIASAVEKGIISGHSDGTFKPKDNITRGQVAILLERAFQIKGENKSTFRDVPTSNKNLYAAVDALVSNGLTAGYPDGTYRPNTQISRAEFAVIIARGLNEQFRVAIVDKPLYERVVNVASSLNVRSGPGTNYSIVGSLSNGTTVQVYSVHGNWVYMKAGKVTGYVSGQYLATPSSPTTRRHIAIDAGHGGTDPGASGNKLVEKVITLEVAKKVEQSLKKKGIDVFMTRTDDTYVGLDERVNRAVNAKVDTLVSIHTNSFTSSTANGTETYYSTASLRTRVDDSKQLATFIQNRLYKALGTTNRGVKTANFVVIKTPFPSALVELAFISNKSDAAKLGSQAYQQKAADAIAAGIVDYYEWKDKQ